MKLNDLEQAMLDGAHGRAAQWAIEYQERVGTFFDAEDFVPVRLIHISTDRETIGGTGVQFIEELAALPPEERRPHAFAAADFRGFDAETFNFLLPGRDLAKQSEEAVAALAKLGVSPSHAYINDHSVTAPAFGEACGYSGTPSVVYMNGLVGARCNFEAGPSSLAAFFTGRVPRYGFHLDARRRATHGFVLDFTPADVSQWGAVGAIIGRKLNSYWSVPAIEVPGARPTVLSLNHMALNLASYGSIAMFHVIGVTPEAPDWDAAFGEGRRETPETITKADVDDFLDAWGGVGEKLDVVALATPQLTITELVEVAGLLDGKTVHADTTLLVYAPREIKEAAERIGLKADIERAGGRLVHGHDFFATFAKEIRESHGWERLMTHSVKAANICAGYGYKPVPAPVRRCVESAIAGKVLA
jgi:predicted aconitase